MSHVHLVFGIKESGEKIDLDSVTTCAIEAPMPRTMTSRQLEMQRIEKSKDDGDGTTSRTHLITKKDQFSRNLSSNSKKSKVKTYEEATAKIANAEQIKTLIQQQNYVKSCNGQGIGHQRICLQPLVLTRKLGHKELIFNETDEKSTYFLEDSASTWIKMPRDNCWICEQWKYCLIFLDKKQL